MPESLRAQAGGRTLRGSRYGFGKGLVSRLAVTSVASLLAAGACVSPRGGWDIDALRSSEPALASIPGERLGDMTPFPAWLDGQLLLVACRWPTGAPIRVRARRDEETEPWVRAAVAAVDESVPGLRLDLSWSEPEPERRERDIQIRSLFEDTQSGPIGVADTLVECLVSIREGEPSRVRGELVGAQIEMRRARPAIAGRLQPLAAEEWVGALMHELGHALGFAGHVAYGDSVLVLEQGSLRGVGRRALAGEVRPEASLEALYGIEPGRTLGVRTLTPRSSAWLVRLSRRLRALEEQGVVVSGPWARVGDREAQLEWRTNAGRVVRVRMPRWSEQLREGMPILALPDRETRDWLLEPEAHSLIEGSIDRARARH